MSEQVGDGKHDAAGLERASNRANQAEIWRYELAASNSIVSWLLNAASKSFGIRIWALLLAMPDHR